MNADSSTGRHFFFFARAWVSARLFAVLLVFLLMTVALASGVGASERPDLAQQSLLAWVYYAGGLFVFGGLDLGTPIGGPAVGRLAMWVAYFLAPAITTTAVADALIRLVRPGWIQRKRLRDHVVLLGAGQVGLAYLHAIRVLEPKRPVLLVDREGISVNADEVSRLGSVDVFRADIRRPATIDALRIDKADRMVVVTDHDLANLEAAWEAKRRRPELPVAVHVADLTLLRPVSRLIRARPREKDGSSNSPLVFNTHRIGALYLYERHLHPHFEETGYRDVLVVGGFGGFAQTILELLRAIAADELARVVIVDQDASRKVRQFAADVPLDALPYVTVDGDMEDPGTWSEVEKAVSDLEATPVYLLAAGQEVVNFRTAMLLRARWAEPRVFARCFHRSEFATSLSDQLSFELLAFEEVLREALKEHYEGLRTV